MHKLNQTITLGVIHLIRGAEIDITGIYRYSLWRIWDPNLPRVAFVMLNPSTADGKIDDRTIRRCIGFAMAWGFGALEVVNLFAYRATNPEKLKHCSDPIGPENDDYIKAAVKRANRIITAWGTKGVHYGRNKEVMQILASYSPQCLEITKAGHPKHPLYVAGSINPVGYSLGAG